MPTAEAGGGFYRKTPNPKAAAGGGGRLDLDVPAFLRKQGAAAETDHRIIGGSRALSPVGGVQEPVVNVSRVAVFLALTAVRPLGVRSRSHPHRRRGPCGRRRKRRPSPDPSRPRRPTTTGVAPRTVSFGEPGPQLRRDASRRTTWSRSLIGAARRSCATRPSTTTSRRYFGGGERQAEWLGRVRRLHGSAGRPS